MPLRSLLCDAGEDPRAQSRERAAQILSRGRVAAHPGVLNPRRETDELLDLALPR